VRIVQAVIAWVLMPRIPVEGYKREYVSSGFSKTFDQYQQDYGISHTHNFSVVGAAPHLHTKGSYFTGVYSFCLNTVGDVRMETRTF
jgi:hypothetical protein